MTDEEMKIALSFYKDAETDCLLDEKIENIQHDFSHKFDRKMRKLFWSEKYFGEKIHLGYAVRRVAIIVLVISSMIAVDKVSAAMTGIHPWKYIWTHITGINMDEKIYTEPNTQINTEATSGSALPPYVPTGYKNTYCDTKNPDYISADWKNNESLIQYDRVRIIDGMTDLIDSDYPSKKGITIHGYHAVLQIKNNQTRIDWADKTFSYNICMEGVQNSETEIIKMADSLYSE